MSVVIHRCEQRTPEWYALRAGKLTASTADALYAKLKSGGEPASRRDLRIAIAIELLTGQPIESDGFVSKEMQRGIDLEPAALGAHEADTGALLSRVGFVERTDRAIGCSPDAVVFEGDRIVGVVQIKCPKSATHIAYLKADELPSDYRAQCIHELTVTGAEWLDFVSYDDRLPEDLQLFRIRIWRRDLEQEIAAHLALVDRFLAEVAVESRELRMLRRAA